ncbi:MAG: hypothetical protein ACPGID_05520 [Rubricella sp.]
MSDSLADLILSHTPEDGSSIGNGAMMALLRERVPGLWALLGRGGAGPHRPVAGRKHAAAGGRRDNRPFR